MTANNENVILSVVVVRFYKTASGVEPVIDYLRSLAAAERAVIGGAIRMIQTHGIADSGVACRNIQGKLWELKVDAQRVF